MKFWPMRTAEPTTKPGLFCGWRLDAGLRYRDIRQVLGYEAVRTRAHLHWLPKGVHENGDPLCPRLSILSSLLGMSLWSFTSCRTPLTPSCYSPGDSHCRDLFIPHLEEKLGLWKGHWIIPKGSPADLPGPVFFPAQLFRWWNFPLKCLSDSDWTAFVNRRPGIGTRGTPVWAGGDIRASPEQETENTLRLFGI